MMIATLGYPYTVIDYIEANTRSLKKSEIKQVLQRPSLGFMSTRKPYLFKKVYIDGSVIFADLRVREGEYSSLNTFEVFHNKKEKTGGTYLSVYGYDWQTDHLEYQEIESIRDRYFWAKWRFLGHKEQPPEKLIKKWEQKIGLRCYLCGKILEYSIEHHISYTHHRIIKICRHCHGKIHNKNGKFVSTKPKYIKEQEEEEKQEIANRRQEKEKALEEKKRLRFEIEHHNFKTFERAYNKEIERNKKKIAQKKWEF